MRIDKYGMFLNRPTGVMSWESHVDQYLGVQRGVRNRLIKAESLGCFNYQYDAWEWATKPPPSQPAP